MCPLYVTYWGRDTLKSLQKWNHRHGSEKPGWHSTKDLQHAAAASRPQTDNLKFKTIAKTLSCVKTGEMNRKKHGKKCWSESHINSPGNYVVVNTHTESFMTNYRIHSYYPHTGNRSSVVQFHPKMCPLHKHFTISRMESVMFTCLEHNVNRNLRDSNVHCGHRITVLCLKQLKGLQVTHLLMKHVCSPTANTVLHMQHPCPPNTRPTLLSL
jgi:hypothetical protein